LKTTLLTLATLAITAAPAEVPRHGQSNSDSPPVLAAVAPATYPAIARAANAHGEVIVEAQVDTAGNAVSTKFISGHPLLQAISEEAAKQWKFSPSEGSTKQRTVRIAFGFQTVDAGPNPKHEFTIVFRPPYRIDVNAHARVIN
jgi:TonB family protein